MKFSDFKSVEDVQKVYPIENRKQEFIPDAELMPPQWFMDDLHFSLSKQASVESEMFFREYFIAPFMREAWKRHPSLKLWVNRKLAYNNELTGEPDYFISAPPSGPTSDPVGKPLLAVAEAKQEDFIAGWGQCLAGMIACQKLNETVDVVIYGIVSNGLVWEFGKLEGTVFTTDLYSFSIRRAGSVLGALDFMFGECERMSQRYPKL
ncbi:MAG: hypothetical protein GY749_43315 [Desulfobacteraceae bacterium]|nr:hypothetical protein [Desulfobacteraceae bacterium]